MHKIKIIMIVTKTIHIRDSGLAEDYQTDDIHKAVQTDITGFADEPDMFISMADTIEFFGKVVDND